MARRSLFHVLVDQPWWLSLLVAVGVYFFGAAVAAFVRPAGASPYFTSVVGVAMALPFLLIALYVGWLRIRRGPSLDTAELLKALRSATPEQVRALLVEACERDRYEIADGPAGDLELRRNGYLTLLRYRRWRAQSTGVAAMDELHAAMRARKADRGMYVTAGSVNEGARSRALQLDVTLLDGPAFAALVQRTRAARSLMRRGLRSAARA